MTEQAYRVNNVEGQEKKTSGSNQKEGRRGYEREGVQM